MLQCLEYLGISCWLEHGFRLCHGRSQLGALGNSAELSQGDEVEPVEGPINGTENKQLQTAWSIVLTLTPLVQMGFLPSANMVRFDKCCRMKYEHIHHGLLAPLRPFRSRSWYTCSEM